MKKRTKLSRKQFLQIIAIGSASGLTLKYGLDAANLPTIASDTRMLMGTIINIKVINSDRDQALAAINASFDKMESLVNVMSHFIENSQLSVLNRMGYIDNAHPALISLVQKSHQISELTHGAFDITVKPLLDLYQESTGIPSNQSIEKILPLVNYKNLQVNDTSLKFENLGMAITLDGIAKGYIVDEGISIFNNLGFSNVMVEAGGDLMASGKKEENSAWKIGILPPRENHEEMNRVVSLQNQAMASSGDYFQNFSTDYLHHHIIDPRVGISSPELASASVIAPSVMGADAIATAIMVMGKEKGLELIEDLEGYEAFIINKKLEISKTTGFFVN